MVSSAELGGTIFALCCWCWVLMFRKIRSETGGRVSPFRLRQLIEEYEVLVDLGRASGLVLNLWILFVVGLIILAAWKLMP